MVLVPCARVCLCVRVHECVGKERQRERLSRLKSRLCYHIRVKLINIDGQRKRRVFRHQAAKPQHTCHNIHDFIRFLKIVFKSFLCANEEHHSVEPHTSVDCHQQNKV